MSEVIDILDPANAPADESPVEVPEDIGAVLKELREVKDNLERLDKMREPFAEREAYLRRQLLAFHDQTGLVSLADHGLSVTFKPDAMRLSYIPEKWDGVLKWLVENDYGYCVQRRFNNAKLRELVDNGVAMPDGVKVEHFVDMLVKRKN